MTEQPEGRTPDDNRTDQPRRPSFDELIAPLDEEARKALREHLAATREQAAKYRRRLSEVEPKAAKFDEATEAAKSEARHTAAKRAVEAAYAELEALVD